MLGLSSLKASQCFPKAHIGTLRHRFRQKNKKPLNFNGFFHGHIQKPIVKALGL